MAKRLLTTLLAAITALLAAVVFVACDGQTPDVKYHVTYEIGADAQGTAPTETDKAVGEKFKLKSADGITNGDKVFAGWNDGNMTYQPGAEYTMPTKSVVFTAQWKDGDNPQKYSVTYNLNGGTGTAPTEIDRAKDETFPVKSAAGITNGTKVFDGWNDGNLTYQPGENYTMPNHAVVFTAQWKNSGNNNPTEPKLIYGALDLDEEALIYLYDDGTGELDYSDATLDKKTASFTYTLSGTAIVITIGGNTFNGTYDGTLLTVQFTYASRLFRFGEKQTPQGKPVITFSANGGSGVAPEIPDEDIVYVEGAGDYPYKVKLPQNTYTPPTGKKFKAWGVNNVNDTHKAGQTFMAGAGEKITILAVWEDVAPPEPGIESVTFTGTCVVPADKLGFNVLRSVTVVEITVDKNDVSKIYYKLVGDDTLYDVNSQNDAYPSYKPNEYGADALYYGGYKIGKGNVAYNILIKSDWTKLYLCSVDDELMDNGEFTVGGEVTPPNPPAPQGYSVTYVKPNGVEGKEPETVTVESGEQVTLAPATTFTKAGWTFYKWQVTGYVDLRAPNTKITVTANTTITPVFMVEYTGLAGKFTVLDNDTLIDSEGGTYSYTRTGDIVVIDFEIYTVTVKVNDAAKTYVMSDGMEAVTFTAANNATLTFDGFGVATLGTHTGTYTLSEDYDKLTIVIGGNTYPDIAMDLTSVPYTINVKITIDGTDYIFGNPQTEDPDPENPDPPATEDKLSDYIGVTFGYASATAAGGDVIKANNNMDQEKTFFKAEVKISAGNLQINIYYTSLATANITRDSDDNPVVADDSVTTRVFNVTSASFTGVTFKVTLSTRQDGKRVMTITYGNQSVTWVEMTA
ncbi:MAG: InlB B-repeat-containing protein [Clostridiales bacterium]|nr:InlB B-repeat-containing protein [Clostridiales bacterium]